MPGAPAYTVMTIDRFHVPDDDAASFYRGFPTAELAIEFARRWTRDSLEDHRKPGTARAEVRSLWSQFGEHAVVRGPGDPGPRVYDSCDEVESFLDHPATAEERDWKAILIRAGLRKG